MRVDDSTVYEWVRAGTVRSIRVAGTVRIPAAELARIANSARASRGADVMLEPADSKLVTGSPSRCNRRVES